MLAALCGAFVDLAAGFKWEFGEGGDDMSTSNFCFFVLGFSGGAGTVKLFFHPKRNVKHATHTRTLSPSHVYSSALQQLCLCFDLQDRLCEKYYSGGCQEFLLRLPEDPKKEGGPELDEVVVSKSDHHQKRNRLCNAIWYLPLTH